jgi:GH35 family endo-1,4-beta-xylanase
VDVLFERYDEIALELGGKYFPSNKKIINETNEALWFSYPTHGKYMPFVAQLDDFLKRKLPIDEIGLQYHIFQREENMQGYNLNYFLNAKYMLEILDIYNSYGLPMHISEITVPSFWGSGEKNEEIQAEIVALLYETWFATEHMKSIVWWNLADGYAAYAPQNTGEGENYYAAGLLRYDLSEKAVYKTLDKLINHDWKTEISLATNEKDYSFRGFYGKYQITVEDETGAKTVEVEFDKNGEKIAL